MKKTILILILILSGVGIWAVITQNTTVFSSATNTKPKLNAPSKTSNKTNDTAASIEELFDRNFNIYKKYLTNDRKINLTKLENRLVNPAVIKQQAQVFCSHMKQFPLKKGMNFLAMKAGIEKLNSNLNNPSPPYIPYVISELGVNTYCQDYLRGFQTFRYRLTVDDDLFGPKRFANTINSNEASILYRNYTNLSIQVGLKPIDYLTLSRLAKWYCPLIEAQNTKGAKAYFDQSTANVSQDIVRSHQFEVVSATTLYCPYRTQQLAATFGWPNAGVETPIPLNLDGIDVESI